ncbi:hypothetical protein YPPY48_3610, partial [Yersinia pestis PY-48]
MSNKPPADAFASKISYSIFT